MNIQQYEKIYKIIKELTIEQVERMHTIFKECYFDDIWDNFCTILSGMGGV